MTTTETKLDTCLTNLDLNKVNKYKVVTFDASENIKKLSLNEQKALKLLAQAGLIVDELFELQSNAKNLQWKEKINNIEDVELKKKYLNYYNSFRGVGKEFPGSAFYPGDLTKEEFQKWVKTLSPEDQTKAKGFFTVIERDSSDKLVMKGYNESYKKYLKPLSNILSQASKLVEDKSLSTFLQSRADSFLSNNYHDSDVAWLKVDSKTIDITIGPYEVYEDELLSIKSTFEMFLGLRDETSTEQLKIFTKNMQLLEDNMPCDNKYKRKNIPVGDPIVVINQIFTAGDAKSGPMTIAFNLPND